MDGARELRMDELLAHAGWVRSLAAALVGDAASAEDLVQDTWLAALHRPPPPDVPPRPWLARIVRNLARNRWRGEERRKRREIDAARLDEFASAGESAAELEMHRELVDALSEIDEPFRTTILRRYFHACSSAEIARAERITESAVRHRLQRGLEMLRAKLDRKHGDRSAWTALLLPIAGRHALPGATVSTASVLAGVITMSTTMKAVTAIVVAAAAIWMWRERHATPASSTVAREESALSDAHPLESPSTTPTASDAALANAREQIPGVHEEAFVEVLVLSEQDHTPISGVHVLLMYGDAKDMPEPSLVATEQRDLGLDRTTDNHGLAVFSVPAGRALWVADWHESLVPGVSHDVSGLKPGERQRVVIECKKSDLVSFYGHVIARADHKPIADALASVEAVPRTTIQPLASKHAAADPSTPSSPPTRIEPPLTDAQRRRGIWNRPLDERMTQPTENEIGVARSDEHGNFEIKMWAWKRPKIHLRITSPGCSPAIAVLEHPTSATEPLEIALERSASIEARVVDANDAPLSDAWIDLSAPWNAWQQPREDVAARGHQLPHPEWSAKTGADGTCTIDGLPPDVPLHGRLSRNGWIGESSIESFELKPGEHRKFEWKLAAGCTLSGEVVDEAGKPVTGVELWLKRARGTFPFPFQPGEQFAANGTTRSDNAGKFHFDAVSAGVWRLGPANKSLMRSTGGHAVLAPSVDVVPIDTGSTLVEHKLVVHPALYISGRVVDPSGGMIDPTKIRTRPPVALTQEDGSRIVIIGHYDSEAGGSFVAGPIAAGTYDVQASCPGMYAPSQKLQVKGGETNVVLRLRENAILAGTVVDATTGSRVDARVVAREDCTDWSLLTSNRATDATAFRFDCLRPGRYEVVARTEDGRVGVASGILVQSGETIDGVSVPVAPGAKLRLTYIGAAIDVHYTLKHGSTVLAESYLSRGIEKLELVPPGHLSLKLAFIESMPEIDRELDVSVGDERSITFNDGD